MSENEFTVLIIEDSVADHDLLVDALQKNENMKIHTIHYKNGQDALNFILDFKNKNYNIPDLIILDLNLPNINGFDILQQIKTEQNLKSIPVIIYSSSDDQIDIELSYKLHANSYITKPFQLKELFHKIAILTKYWFEVSEPPNSKKGD